MTINNLTIKEIIHQLCHSDNNQEAYQRLSECLVKKADLENKPASMLWLETVITDLKLNARHGKTMAMVLLGNAYINGWGIEQNISQALKYARYAASLGDAGGEVLLGYLYANGYGVVKDPGRAMTWFKSALEKGNSMASNNLGVIYEQGLGVKKDMKLALYYYKQAAAQHNPLGEKNLERLGLSHASIPSKKS